MSVLAVGDWQAVPDLVHGFLSSAPGADVGDWGGQLDAYGLPRITVAVARQVHGTRIEIVTDATQTRPEADGLLTATNGIAVGVITADCVPVLLLAPKARVAAAIHSGWRGTLGGIVTEAAKMTAAKAAVPVPDLQAAIGPAIGVCCYEVGPEIRAAFEERHGKAFVAPAFRPVHPRPHLDLRHLVRCQLEAAGLRPLSIHILGPCTSCDRAYASARRDGPGASRQLSFIGWR